MIPNLAMQLIDYIGIFIVTTYLVTEFLEEGSFAGLLHHLTADTKLFYHVTVFFTIPAFAIIGHYYRKQRNISKNFEKLVVKRTRQLKETNDLLVKSEKIAAIGQAATMVGHDLRNPLQAIENGVFLLDTELAKHSIYQKTSKTLQAIHDSIKYADNIVNNLISFAATRKPEFLKTNINKHVKEVLSQVKTQENIEIVIDVNQLPEIEADEKMIKRIILNLSNNGIQAMEKTGGILKVSTREKNGFIEISFEDTGIGIKKENLEKIFTPFFTTKAQGMGVGLAICKRFVELHGGSIEIESEEGKGSRCIVEIPMHISGLM